MSLGNWSDADEIFSADSCLSGCGGFWNGIYFHSKFPQFILNQKLHIGALEMLTLVVCLHLWGKHFKNMRIKVLCDNMSVCIALNSGRARCPFLQDCLREICFIAASNEFELRAEHLFSEENRLADYLSRWDSDKMFREKFYALTESLELLQYKVQDEDFRFWNSW